MYILNLDIRDDDYKREITARTTTWKSTVRVISELGERPSGSEMLPSTIQKHLADYRCWMCLK